jgi:tetratricopeptide (TPR) repeat protein
VTSWWLSFWLLLAAAPFFGAGAEQNPQPQREFEKAVQLYDSHRLAEAASQLEPLVREFPQSFDVQELLGMVYSAEGKDADATEHLTSAVRLNPNSVAARTNLATNLLGLGRFAPAELEFKKALALNPASYDTNHNLGEFYVAGGKIAQAIPFLEKAREIKPEAHDNAYDLALAYLETGNTSQAERLVKSLLEQWNTAELHNLLGEIEEKTGNFLSAEHEYEAAAHMDPSEGNLFDWASELLLHRTLDPAVEVFTDAARRYPTSQRLAIGLGLAYYSRGNYDDAVKALLQATDLNPRDPRCYYFLSKAYDSSPRQADEVIQRFRRFAELQPENSHALYYYAMSLWKGRREQDADLDVGQIESLLKKSVELDPKFAEPRLQLGNLLSDQKKYSEAVPQYLRALALNPDLADAHYRLGLAYVRLGRRDVAQQHFQVYQNLRAEHLAELDRQRADVRQFVISEKENASSNHSGSVQP